MTREPPERTRYFTTKLIEAASPGRGALSADVTRQQGTVDYYSEARGFGYINGDDRNSYFVHIREVRATGPIVLTQGQRVQFSVVEDKPRDRAIDVEVFN